MEGRMAILDDLRAFVEEATSRPRVGSWSGNRLAIQALLADLGVNSAPDPPSALGSGALELWGVEVVYDEDMVPRLVEERDTQGNLLRMFIQGPDCWYSCSPGFRP
jgi:hypothetical protein